MASDGRKRATSMDRDDAPSDDPFALIEKGNAMESSGNLWSAADAFGLASALLRAEASRATEEIARVEQETSAAAATATGGGRVKSVTERAALRSRKLTEKRKIAALYLEQSRSYLHRARVCLLKALNFETAEDERRARAAESMTGGPLGRKLKVMLEQAEPLVGMLPKDEAKRRRRIFGRIYASAEDEEEKEKKGLETETEGSTRPQENEPGKNQAEAEAEAAVDDGYAEMEAELLEQEMDAELDLSIPAAPGTETNKGKDAADEEEELSIPAAPGAGRFQRDGGRGGLAIPPLPPAERPDSTAIPPPPPGSGAGSVPGPPRKDAPASLATAEGRGEEGGGEEEGLSLERRLAQFESTLPPSVKSQDERMANIQRGLGRLGLSVPDQTKSIANVFQNRMTEEEQIRRIVDMAADEALLEGSPVDAAIVAAAVNGGGSGGDGGADGGDDLVVNDGDDLGAVLTKAGLSADELKGQVQQLEDVLGEEGKELLRDVRTDGGKAVADRARALALIGRAQELLFEASANLEDDEDLDREDEDLNSQDKNDKEASQRKESNALRKGRANLVGAQKCLEGALASLPKKRMIV